MYSSPLFWEQGVFLQPQHFQLERRQIRETLATDVFLLNPYLWGVIRLAINEDALNGGFFEISELEMLLPTAGRILLQDNATLSPRAFGDAWTNPEQPLPVFIGIAPYKAVGSNVFETDNPDEAPGGFRFTAPLSPDKVPDLHGNGPSANIRTMRFNLRIYFGDEGKDVELFPVARLLREGERIRLDTSFIPPCVDIHASSTLVRIIKNIRDTLLSRSRQLEDYKIIAGDASSTDTTQFSTAQGLILFNLLGVLSRNIPELDQFLHTPSIHPWPIFMMLCRLVGELSIFSADLSPLGETPYGERVLPIYNHNCLQDCFSAASAIVSRLVDTLVIGPAFTFVLEPDESGSLHVAMPMIALDEYFSYWLMLRTAHLEELAGSMKSVAKLLPSSGMSGILSRALPGVRLNATEQPPAGLPRRSDTLYFHIDQGDPLWKTVLGNGEVTLILPEKPDDLLVQLAVIQR